MNVRVSAVRVKNDDGCGRTDVAHSNVIERRIVQVQVTTLNMQTQSPRSWTLAEMPLSLSGWNEAESIAINWRFLISLH